MKILLPIFIGVICFLTSCSRVTHELYFKTYFQDGIPCEQLQYIMHKDKKELVRNNHHRKKEHQLNKEIWIPDTVIDLGKGSSRLVSLCVEPNDFNGKNDKVIGAELALEKQGIEIYLELAGLFSNVIVRQPCYDSSGKTLYLGDVNLPAVGDETVTLTVFYLLEGAFWKGGKESNRYYLDKETRYFSYKLLP